MHTEVPDVAVHPLFAQEFRNRVFTGRQRGFHREFDPAFAELLGGSGNNFLFLAALAVNRSLDCSNNALIALYFRANNAEPVPREFETLGLLVLGGFGASIHIDI